MARVATPPKPVVQRTLSGVVITGMMVLRRGLLDPTLAARNSGLSSERWIVDGATLRQVVAAGNRAGAQPMKALFGSPSPLEDGIGKYLGRWRSFRLSLDRLFVLADLHLVNTAMRGESSKGGYLVELIEEDHEAVGVNIRLGAIDTVEMRREGNRRGRMPLRVQTILGADVVDESNVIPEPVEKPVPALSRQPIPTLASSSVPALQTIERTMVTTTRGNRQQVIDSAVAEYEAHGAKMLKHGTYLASYVESALRDDDPHAALSEAELEVLHGKQGAIGRPMGPTGLY